ncbi:hypothetical protein N7470_006081 [Penicillium chermesinum]|nr:hypothetical protein N7470_006081 [Penicillium chermesinum]
MLLLPEQLAPQIVKKPPCAAKAVGNGSLSCLINKKFLWRWRKPPPLKSGSLDLSTNRPHRSNFWRPPGSLPSKDSSAGGRYVLLDLSITHPICTTQLAIAQLRQFLRNGGLKQIVHITSFAVQNEAFAATIHVAMTQSINGLDHSLAKLERLGIRVAVVVPSVTKPPLWIDYPEKTNNGNGWGG